MKTILTLLCGIFFAFVAQGQVPVITTQPVTTTVYVGQRATFSVVATGATAYQWELNGKPLAGMTSSVYTSNITAKSDNGANISVVVSNASGSVTSTVVKLDVTAEPSVVISWIAPVGGGTYTGYRIYRTQLSNGLLTTLSSTATTYTDSTALTGQTYSYVMTATNGTTESTYSTVATVTMP
jgi:hypothetical protein